MSEAPLVYSTPEVVRFHSLVYDKRWGTAAAANSEAIDIWDLVSSAFNHERYLGGGGVRDPIADDDG